MKPPLNKPNNPRFSTGPSTKRKDYNISNINTNLFGRSHRSKEINTILAQMTQKIRAILQIPDNFKIITTPASDSGSFEIALWNFIGNNPVDMLVWDNFGAIWQHDLEKQLKIKELNIFQADYGKLPDLNQVNFANHDVIFTYCGTTSGVIFNREDLIPNDRKGLILADATSFVFSENIPWDKIDILSFSWQKALGGEAQHGTLIFSPRALERLKSNDFNRAIPSILNLKDQNQHLRTELWEQYQPINTPSLFAIFDFLDVLSWAEVNGSLPFLQSKVNNNFSVISKWVKSSAWISFLAEEISYTSKMSVCLKIKDSKYLSLPSSKQKELVHNMTAFLSQENVAYDINSYKTAPLGIRIWCGPTVEQEDLEKLTPWLDYAFNKYIQEA